MVLCSGFALCPTLNASNADAATAAVHCIPSYKREPHQGRINMERTASKMQRSLPVRHRAAAGIAHIPSYVAPDLLSQESQRDMRGAPASGKTGRVNNSYQPLPEHGANSKKQRLPVGQATAGPAGNRQWGQATCPKTPLTACVVLFLHPYVEHCAPCYCRSFHLASGSEAMACTQVQVQPVCHP